MAEITLYHFPLSRSAVTRWLLEELGQPYEIKLMRLREGEQYAPEFRALNPMAKLPTIVHRGVPVSESAAICTYLADEFPEAKLNKPIGDPDRGPYLKWLFFGPSCVEPAITDKAFPRVTQPPRAAAGYGDFDSVLEVLTGAMGKGIRERFAQAHEKQKHAKDSVAAGREFVESYVGFTHYVEGLHGLIKSEAAHHGGDAH